MSTGNKDLTPKEAAAELGCHVDFVRSQIRARALSPVVKINQRVIRIPVETLRRYKQQRTA